VRRRVAVARSASMQHIGRPTYRQRAPGVAPWCCRTAAHAGGLLPGCSGTSSTTQYLETPGRFPIWTSVHRQASALIANRPGFQFLYTGNLLYTRCEMRESRGSGSTNRITLKEFLVFSLRTETRNTQRKADTPPPLFQTAFHPLRERGVG
jgi:hypothetical protein